MLIIKAEETQGNSAGKAYDMNWFFALAFTTKVLYLALTTKCVRSLIAPHI